MGNPTYFQDDTAVTAGEARVPLANFDNGCNSVASNSNGIGINIDGGALPDINGLYAYSPGWNWTLEDQFENTRQGQIGQLIGGSGITLDTDWPGSGGTEGTAPDATIRDATNADNVDGAPVAGAEITTVGNASLVTLAAGWVSVP